MIAAVVLWLRVSGLRLSIEQAFYKAADTLAHVWTLRLIAAIARLLTITRRRRIVGRLLG